MKMEVKGIPGVLASIKLAIEAKKKEKLRTVTAHLLTKLEEATPVKTGFARDSWKAEIIGNKAIISNSAPYIEELNRGSSQQAPAYFIEKVILQDNNVVPNGTIVSYR